MPGPRNVPARRGRTEEAPIARTPKAPTGGETEPARRRAASAAKPRAAKPAARASTAGTAKPAARKPAAAKDATAKPRPARAAAAKPAPKPAARKASGANPAPARKPAAKPAAKPPVAAKPDGAPARRTKKEKVAPDRLEQMVAAVRASLEDDKAENILVLDVTGRADYADRLIIATGQVERQLQAMATHLEEALEKIGYRMRRSDIQSSPDWVLIDAGDLVVHLFRPEARVTYALERMWGPGSPAPEGSTSPA